MLDPTSLIVGLLGCSPAVFAYFSSKSETRKALKHCQGQHEECLAEAAKLGTRVQVLETALGIKGVEV